MILVEQQLGHTVHSFWITGNPEANRLQRTVAMSSQPILELAVGASGPTTGASFPILKA